MSRAAKPGIIFQLLAIALHSSLFAAFVLAGLPQIGDRLSVAEPLRESRVVAPAEFTDGATITRGVKPADNETPSPVSISAVFHPPLGQRPARLSVSDSQRFEHRVGAGNLAIRSPPSAPSR
jgi:hypothetical protein